MTIAETTLNQLTLSHNGYNRLKAMIGAYDFVTVKNGIQFKFKGCRAVNTLTIVLEADDTYTLEFWKIRRSAWNCQMVNKITDMYAADLKDCFEDFTQLRVSLTEEV